MITFVRMDLSANRKAFNTKVEVRTYYTLDPSLSRNVFVAVVTMV